MAFAWRPSWAHQSVAVFLFPGVEFPSQGNERPVGLAKASSTRQGQTGEGTSFQHRQEVSQGCRQGPQMGWAARTDHTEGTGMASPVRTVRAQHLCARQRTQIIPLILTRPNQGGARIIKTPPVGKWGHRSDNQLTPRSCPAPSHTHSAPNPEGKGQLAQRVRNRGQGVCDQNWGW